jgi:glycosyltransferase involved in cell wall biosynthesis
MRILIIAENFAPAWAFGGPPKVLFEIARELVKRQHSVTVFAANVLDAHSEIEKRCDTLEGIKVYYLRTLSKRLAWNTKFFIPIGLRKLLKEIMGSIDIVLLSSLRTIFSLLGYHYSRKFKKPYILLPYGSIPRGTGLKKVMKWVIDPLYGYRTIRDAPMIFAQTEHEMLEARRYGAEDSKIKLVPLNIDLSEFQILPPKGMFRRRLNISNRVRLVLFLGRVHRHKGLDLLIRSFANVSRIMKNSRLVIIGRDDGYLSSVLELIKSLGLQEKATFFGSLYGKDRLEAYVDADIFVMPSSNFEETSKAALEACASSTPVIVTRQASIPGLDEHHAGITIDYHQTELEDALLRILSNRKLRLRMCANARTLVMKSASLTSAVDKFEEAFRMLTQPSS